MLNILSASVFLIFLGGLQYQEQKQHQLAHVNGFVAGWRQREGVVGASRPFWIDTLQLLFGVKRKNCIFVLI